MDGLSEYVAVVRTKTLAAADEVYGKFPARVQAPLAYAAMIPTAAVEIGRSVVKFGWRYATSPWRVTQGVLTVASDLLNAQ